MSSYSRSKSTTSFVYNCGSSDYTAVEKPQLITLKLQKLTVKVVLNLDCNVINSELYTALNIKGPSVLHGCMSDGSEKKDQ